MKISTILAVIHLTMLAVQTYFFVRFLINNRNHHKEMDRV